jgi:isopenicillin N synthase-like dioxygenase
MGPTSRTAHGDELVPLVDVTGWADGGAAARGRIAAALDEACRRSGFFRLSGHGIPDGVLAGMLDATARFFALPMAEKLALVPGDRAVNRGYAPLASEALTYSLGVAAGAPDLFEAFNVGPDVVPDDPWHRQAPHHFFAPNLWPDALPTLRPALSAYFDAAVAVGMMLTDVFALALGLPERWFRPFVDRSTLTMRVNHYERYPGAAPALPGQMRMGAHTDYGIVTVLYADPEPGLQIMGPDGSWHDVAPDPGGLLVNLGDLTAQWTNDRWRSTLHRVVPPGGSSAGPMRRRSVALFLDGNYDAVIECVPTCATGTAVKYPSVIAGEHLIAKLMGPRTLSPSEATDTAGERLSRLDAPGSK